MKIPIKLKEKILKGELDVFKTYTAYELIAWTYDKDNRLIHINRPLEEQGGLVVNYNPDNKTTIVLGPWLELENV